MISLILTDVYSRTAFQKKKIKCLLDVRENRKKTIFTKCEALSRFRTIVSIDQLQIQSRYAKYSFYSV